MEWSSPAPAKVNLSLNVTGRRDDGYHDLTSFVAFTSYADKLTISDDRPTGLSISGPFSAELQDNLTNNLLLQTKRAVIAAGFSPQSHHIHLEKHIPVSSGLGGGSSDVAAYLRCLANMMASSTSDKHRLLSLGNDIGADVPVCLQPGFQIMKENGKNVCPARLKEKNLYCVLANPGISVSTANIFRALEETDFSADIAPFAEHSEQQLKDVIARGNDLCRPAIQACPQIATLFKQIRQSSVADQLSGIGMSGSGASCFALSTAPDVVKQLCDELTTNGYWAVATHLIN